MKTIAILPALFAAAAHVAPAAAQTQPPERVAIRFGDLDLATAAGRHALDLRILHAVNATCGEASPADLHGQNAARSCREALRAEAAAQREVVLAAARESAPRALAGRR